MGFLDALSAAVTPALQYRTGQLQGEQQKEEKGQENFLTALKLLRQQQADQLDAEQRRAQMALTQKQTELLGAPKPPSNVVVGAGGALVGPDGKVLYTNPKDDTGPLEAVVGPGGRPVLRPRSQAVGAEPYQKPESDKALKTWQGPNGEILNLPPGTNPPPNYVPYSSSQGGSLSGLTMQTMGRMGTSFNDLSQAVDQMEHMENDPAFRAKLTALNKSLMAGAETQPNAEAKGVGGFASNMLGQLASGKAQQSLDPDLNTYLNLKQRVGTAFTELLPRPNQQLLQIEKGLSGIDVGWNPQLLQGIQARRRGGLDVLKNILSQQGMLNEKGEITGSRGSGGRGGQPSTVPRETSGADLPPSVDREKYASDAAYRAWVNQKLGRPE